MTNPDEPLSVVEKQASALNAERHPIAGLPLQTSGGNPWPNAEPANGGGGLAFGDIGLPSEMTEEDMKVAVRIIEDWEASHLSACELIAQLYPMFAVSASRRLLR